MHNPRSEYNAEQEHTPAKKASGAPAGLAVTSSPSRCCGLRGANLCEQRRSEISIDFGRRKTLAHMFAHHAKGKRKEGERLIIEPTPPNIPPGAVGDPRAARRGFSADPRIGPRSRRPAISARDQRRLRPHWQPAGPCRAAHPARLAKRKSAPASSSQLNYVYGAAKKAKKGSPRLVAQLEAVLGALDVLCPVVSQSARVRVGTMTPPSPPSQARAGSPPLGTSSSGRAPARRTKATLLAQEYRFWWLRG
jgi:hypothetical protein